VHRDTSFQHHLSKPCWHMAGKELPTSLPASTHLESPAGCQEEGAQGAPSAGPQPGHNQTLPQSLPDQ
jgi:hypothetical protein